MGLLLRMTATGTPVLVRRIRTRLSKREAVKNAGTAVNGAEDGGEPAKDVKDGTARPAGRRKRRAGDVIGLAGFSVLLLGYPLVVAMVHLASAIARSGIAMIVVATCVLAWAVAATANSPLRPAARPAEQGKPPVPKAPRGPSPVDDDAALLRWTEAAIVAAFRRGRTGLQIIEMVSVLEKQGHSVTKEHLLERLRALGVPVREGLGAVIDGKKTTRAGVHHLDLAESLRRPLQAAQPVPAVHDEPANPGNRTAESGVSET
ncbi:hypothetical protein [Kitasatospora sp. NPDC088783]|uniref:hypothetical protein n=1 Tax=Kitasatospora sp. NPDC088783 TaxID=3364077 RepID=UPI00382C1C12